MSLPKPEAVIFDWDNTLVDTWPIIHAALNNTFREFGLPEWALADTKNRVRKSMRDSFPEIFGPDWEMAGKRYQDHYRAEHLGKLHELPGAEAVLKALQARGVPMFVVSNKKGPNLRTELNHLGWQGYFQTVIGADDASHDKPHCAPVLLALAETDHRPGPELWFIGDSDIDLACAQATGCTPILFGDHASGHAEYTDTHFLGFPYLRHARDHAELLGMIGEHNP